jgi:hypothetical protein
VESADRAEVGFFERGGRVDSELPKGRAQVLRQLPVILLSAALLPCEAFQRYVLEVAADEGRARPIARQYVRSGAQLLVMERVVIEAARAPQGLVGLKLPALGMRAVFPGGPLDDGDQRYALRTGKLPSLWHGAQVVQRRGAGLCLRCGDEREPERLDRYCRACSPKAVPRIDSYDAKQILLEVADQLGIPTRKGPQAQRIQRRTAKT